MERQVERLELTNLEFRNRLDEAEVDHRAAVNDWENLCMNADG
jgi:hypothetical protein